MTMQVLKTNWPQFITLAVVIFTAGRAEQHREDMQRDIDRLYRAEMLKTANPKPQFDLWKSADDRLTSPIY